jgi:hypothetical protein
MQLAAYVMFLRSKKNFFTPGVHNDPHQFGRGRAVWLFAGCLTGRVILGYAQSSRASTSRSIRA